jgi:hypothetical protein
VEAVFDGVNRVPATVSFLVLSKLFRNVPC